MTYIKNEIFKELTYFYKNSDFNCLIENDILTISGIKNRFENEIIFNKIEDICYLIFEENREVLKEKKYSYLISNYENKIKLSFVKR